MIGNQRQSARNKCRTKGRKYKNRHDRIPDHDGHQAAVMNRSNKGANLKSVFDDDLHATVHPAANLRLVVTHRSLISKSDRGNI